MWKKGYNACSRVAAPLVGVRPIDTSCTFAQAERSTRPDDGIYQTYQTDRIWHAKATPQLNESPRLTRSSLHVRSSLMHQQNSVNQNTREYALQMEKLQHVTIRSMLFNASKLLRAAANSRVPILTKKDPTDLSEWFERSKSHRMLWASLSLLTVLVPTKKNIGHRSRSEGQTWLILDLFFSMLLTAERTFKNYVTNL